MRDIGGAKTVEKRTETFTGPFVGLAAECERFRAVIGAKVPTRGGGKRRE